MIEIVQDTPKLAIIGLGYVGLPLAVAFGKSRPVVGLTSMKPGASALIVAVAHDQFRNLPLQQLRDFCHGPKPVLADLKSLYDRSAATTLGFTVFRL